MIKKFIDGEPLTFELAKLAGYAEFTIGLCLQILGVAILGQFGHVEKYRVIIPALTSFLTGTYILRRGLIWNDFTSPSYHWGQEID